MSEFKVRGYKPGIAIAPGETIREVIEDREWTITQFASLMKMEEILVKALLNGSLRITPNVASSLQRVTEIPTNFWMNLEITYSETIQRLYEEGKAKEKIEGGSVDSHYMKNLLSLYQDLKNNNYSKVQAEYNSTKFF